MGSYGDLLNVIANDLNIIRGVGESESDYEMRVVYSVLCRMGYSSLWDIQDDTTPVSVVHFKKKIESVAKSYCDMYPELGEIFGKSDEIADYIYKLYLDTGYIYHKPNRILPSQKSSAWEEGILFTRGYPLGEKQYICGAGNYRYTKERPATSIELGSMFHMGGYELNESWKQLVIKANWLHRDIEEKVEYLNTNLSKVKSYWVNKPNKDENEYVMRTGFEGNHLYYLYKYQDGEMFISQIPEWLCADGAYRGIINQCLKHYNCLPQTRYAIEGSIVNIQVGYLYPPAEQKFMLLYSWAQNNQDLIDANFNRIMNKDIFTIFKSMMEKCGYLFEEV